jgi:hypothetical protein
VRRTRIGGGLIDGTGEVPLAEDSEQYDLEILFGNAVVRVIGGLTSPGYVYTSADQATDFPGFVAQGHSNSGSETGDLSGWTVESGGTWTVDDAHESLSGGHTGSWFVRSTGDGVLAQTVDVSSIARQIDLGGAQARADAGSPRRRATPTRHAFGCSFWMRATSSWAWSILASPIPQTRPSCRSKLWGRFASAHVTAR